MILLLISFIAGLLTVLAPCILPLLPIIVGGSLTEARVNIKKNLTIIISLGLSVILFTLLLKVSSIFINVPPYFWNVVSGGIILILGLITLFPSLWENKIIARLNSKSNTLVGKGEKKKSFVGDIIIGAALGPVFSSCSPTYFIILATVLPVNPIIGLTYLLAYVAGLGISLFVIALIGQRIMNSLNIVANPKGTFKRVLAVIFIIVGLTILTGIDKKIESDITGLGFFDVTKIEQRLLEKNVSPNLDKSKFENSNINRSTNDATKNKNTNQPKVNNEKKENNFLTKKQKSLIYRKVPEISSPNGFINTNGNPISLESLRGKVVLLDIWTYSCINCQRTIPYLNEWYKKYKDEGFVIVGLHTPEFSFEKVQANVEKAVKQFGIKYPVVMDNDYSTWNALDNQYWPRKYLIDMDGYIVYDHIGEGGYGETEKEIQKALEERAYRLGMNEQISTSISKPDNTVSIDQNKIASPEIYFGSKRNDYLANGETNTDGEQSLKLPSNISANRLYLSGDWNFSSEYAETKTGSEIVFKYKAKNVYMVASSNQGVDVNIYRDGVFFKTINIVDEKLYTLIEGSDYSEHTLKIKIPKGGFKAFTFTFG